MSIQKLEDTKRFCKKNKQKLLAGSFAVFWAFSSIMAWLGSTDTVTNRFNSTFKPKVEGEIKIAENFPSGEVNGDNVTLEKDVWVYNTNYYDVYTRLYVDEENTNITGREGAEGTLSGITWNYGNVAVSGELDNIGTVTSPQTASQDSYIIASATYTENGVVHPIIIRVNLANINVDDGQTGNEWEFIGDESFGRFYYTDDLEGVGDNSGTIFAKDSNTTSYNAATSSEKSVMGEPGETNNSEKVSKTKILVDSVTFVEGAQYINEFTLNFKMDCVQVSEENDTENADSVKKDDGEWFGYYVGDSWADEVTTSSSGAYTRTESAEIDRVNWHKSGVTLSNTAKVPLYMTKGGNNYVMDYGIDDDSVNNGSGNTHSGTNRALSQKAIDAGLSYKGTKYDSDGLYFENTTITGIKIPVKYVSDLNQNATFVLTAKQIGANNSDFTAVTSYNPDNAKKYSSELTYGWHEEALKQYLNTKANSSSSYYIVTIPKEVLQAANKKWNESTKINKGDGTTNSDLTITYSNGTATEGTNQYVIEDYITVTGFEFEIPSGYTLGLADGSFGSAAKNQVAWGYLNSNGGDWSKGFVTDNDFVSAPWYKAMNTGDIAFNVESRYFIGAGDAVQGAGHCLMFDFLIKGHENEGWEYWRYTSKDTAKLLSPSDNGGDTGNPDDPDDPDDGGNEENRDNNVVKSNKSENYYKYDDDVTYVSILGDSISTIQGVSTGSSARYAHVNNATGMTSVNTTNNGQLEIDRKYTWWGRITDYSDSDTVELLVNSSNAGDKTSDRISYSTQLHGSSTAGVYENDDVTAYTAPDYVIIYLGTNDMGATPAVSATGEFKNNYNTLLDNITKEYPETKVYCLSISDCYYNGTTKTNTAADYNAVISELAGSYTNATYISYSAFTDEELKNARNLGTDRGAGGDGIHPNAIGMEKIASAICGDSGNDWNHISDVPTKDDWKWGMDYVNNSDIKSNLRILNYNQSSTWWFSGAINTSSEKYYLEKIRIPVMAVPYDPSNSNNGDYSFSFYVGNTVHTVSVPRSTITALTTSGKVYGGGTENTYTNGILNTGSKTAAGASLAGFYMVWDYVDVDVSSYKIVLNKDEKIGISQATPSNNGLYIGFWMQKSPKDLGLGYAENVYGFAGTSTCPLGFSGYYYTMN